MYKVPLIIVLYGLLLSEDACAVLQFIGGFQIDMEGVHTEMRPLLQKLGDYRNLQLSVIQRLTYLTQLFPNTFNEKFCDQLLVCILPVEYYVLLCLFVYLIFTV